MGRSTFFINRILYMLPAIFLCIGMLVFAPNVYAEGETLIGQATAGETGRTTNNIAGDQTGRECAISRWGYGGGAYNWVYVFRAKDPAIAKKMAETMIKACENDCIGYDLNDRVTCYDEAEKVEWDVEKITVNCETSCVDLVAVCLEAAGISAPRGWASKSVYGDLMPTGLFDCYTSSDYTASSANLLPGDILCNPNAPHTAMVVQSANSFYFDVSYQDVQGEEHIVKIKDGEEVKLNLNNGKEPVSVKIETTTDLGDYRPERKGANFIGWEKNEDENFYAVYQMSMMSIRTGNKKKKL